MKPVALTLSDASAGALYSSVIAVDFHLNPTTIAIQALVVGVVNYTVQYTFDAVFAAGYLAASGNWTDHPQLAGQTITADSNIAFPVTGIRLKQSSGAGSTRITVIQAG